MQQVNKKIDFSQPTRQNSLGVLLLFLINLRKSASAALPLIILMLNKLSSLREHLIWVYIGAALIILGFIVLSWFQYLRFQFHIENGQFILETGVFSRKKLNVPIERIQSIHLNQTIIQRLLNVTGLEIDTAGSKGHELKMVALNRNYAEGLRAFLLDKKAEILDIEVADSIAKNQAAESTLKAEAPRILLKISLPDLLLIGLTQNHIRTGLVAMGIIWGYSTQLQDSLGFNLIDYLSESANPILSAGITVAFAAILGFLMVSLFLSLIITLLKYFDFTAYTQPKGLRISSGLLNKKEYQVPAKKIQSIKWDSNPLRQLAGLKTITLYQATSFAGDSRAMVSIPGCRAQQMQSLYERYLPETQGPMQMEWKPDRFYQSRLLLIYTLIPLLVLAAFLFWVIEDYYWILPLFAVLSAFNVIKYYGSVKIRFFKEGVQIQKGWIFPSCVDLPLYKLQNLSLKQSIFQEKRGIVSLQLHTAADTETIPFIPRAQAQLMYNYLLRYIESSTKKWM